MKTLYLDLPSGLSGDMFLGSLLDLGVDLHELERELAKLGADGFHLHANRVIRSQIQGVKFDVHLASHPEHHHGHGHDHHHHEHAGHVHRTFAGIKDMISDSALSAWVRQKATAVFHRIAVAEGKIHGLQPAQVEFHEVGALDSIVDIVGVCIALEKLGRPRVLAGALVDGQGWVECAHGRLPIPVPATLEILAARGVPISQCEEPHELITPTGAGLLAEFVESFGPMENLAPERIGIGFGSRQNKTRPNFVRAILGNTGGGGGHDWETDTVAVLQTNLDDTTPEILGHVMQVALEAGALDVFHTPIQMKKNRPAVLLTVLCVPSQADQFSEMILRETSAFGLRRCLAERRKLRREFQTVATPHGPVTLKTGLLDGAIIQAAPEFESCKKLAESAGVPVKQVFEAALTAARKRRGTAKGSGNTSPGRRPHRRAV